MDKLLKIAQIPVAPGETLLEFLENYNMTQKELSLRLNMTPKHVNEIIKGKATITTDTASRLESVFGMPASFWINLEGIYQEAKANELQMKSTEDEKEIASKINYAELAKLGWLNKTRKLDEKIINLRKYFSVASLSSVQTTIPTAFRTSAAFEASELALAAWVRKGEIEAQKIETTHFSKNKLSELVDRLRNLTTSKLDLELLSNIQRICSEYGIALVVLPHIQKTHVNGAAKWISPSKLLIQLSLKGAYEDIFWFSLFHELGHITFNHVSKKETLIDLKSKHNIRSSIETQADTFASNTLIPFDKYQDYINKCKISKNSIRDFANSINIDIGIVVGRLAKDKFISFSRFSALRRKTENLFMEIN